jgi:hypothetical protein
MIVPNEQMDILTGGIGTQHPFIVDSAADQITFSNSTLVDSIGSYYQADGSLSNVSYEIDVPDGFATLELQVGDLVGEAGTFYINDQPYSPPTSDTFTFLVDPGAVTLSYDAPDEGYIPITCLVLHAGESSGDGLFIA